MSSYPLPMAIIKKPEKDDARGKLEPLYTVSGDVKWYSHHRKQYSGSSKKKKKAIILSSNSTCDYKLPEN